MLVDWVYVLYCTCTDGAPMLGCWPVGKEWHIAVFLVRLEGIYWNWGGYNKESFDP